MSDIYNRPNTEEGEMSLEEYKALVKHLHHELATRDTTISFLQQELEAAKHRESRGDEREKEQREKNFDLWAKLVSTNLDLGLAREVLKRERELTKSLRKQKEELVCELGVKTALLERRT